jgi:colanic acid/amylovoran biosynthesis glycosyltransferase
MNKKQIVAHYSNAFFLKSETFIYHYLTHMRQFIPICLAWKLEHTDQFAFPRGNIYSLPMPQGSIKWYIHGIMKRVFNRFLNFEKIMREREVSLIHAHFGHNGVAAMRMNRTMNIPMVTTFYGADLSVHHVIRQLKHQYRLLFQKGKMFLVEGPYMKEKLQELGCPEQKIQIQRIAIPVDTVEFNERKPRTTGPVKLIFCGRFTEKKGLIYALEAVKRVKQQKRDILFTVIGDGRLKEEIHEYVAEHNLSDCVHFPGFLKYSEYLAQLREADIFIHPSVTAANGDSEGGAPTTILEAQAMGLPVISTYHADIPNIVVPDRSALLSAEKNVDALVQNIVFLMENQHLWSQMGKTGRDFVETYHDIKKETPKLEEKYHSVLSAVK